MTSPPDVVGDNYLPPNSDSNSSTDSDLEMSSTEEFTATPAKPLRKRKAEKKNSPVKKRAKPQHMLSEWMYNKYSYSGSLPLHRLMQPVTRTCIDVAFVWWNYL